MSITHTVTASAVALGLLLSPVPAHAEPACNEDQPYPDQEGRPMMLIPRITVVEYDEQPALMCWSDEDGCGLEFADGSRRIVNAEDVHFVRYIQDGEGWTR